MWKGYESALARYFDSISLEWINRGYKHNMGLYKLTGNIEYPPWFGNERFHLSHKSNLIRKMPTWYYPIFGDDISGMLPYYWPTKEV